MGRMQAPRWCARIWRPRAHRRGAFPPDWAPSARPSKAPHPRAPAGCPPCVQLAVPEAAPAWFYCHCNSHINLHLMGHAATGPGAIPV